MVCWLTTICLYSAGSARARQGAGRWYGRGGRARTPRPAAATRTATAATPRLTRPLSPGLVSGWPTNVLKEAVRGVGGTFSRAHTGLHFRKNGSWGAASLIRDIMVYVPNRSRSRPNQNVCNVALTGARSKRHASMLSPQSGRQRSRLAGSSPSYHPESAGIKQEALETHSPGAS